MCDEHHEQEISDWLLQEIRDTIYMDRLTAIGQAIADDVGTGAEFTKDNGVMEKLRVAYRDKKHELRTRN